jgi:Uma2 family endonuclease
MTSVISKLTYDEFQTLPRDGSKRYELIEGEVFMTPSPNTAHQRAVRKLLRALDEFVEQRGLGEVFIAPYDIVFSKWTALERTFSSFGRTGPRSSRTPTCRARRTS